MPEAEPAAAWPGPLVQLPDDALLAICAQLDPGSVAALGGTCHRLHTVAAAPHLWCDFCAARWRRPLLHLASTAGEGTVISSCSVSSQLLARCKLVWQAAACLPTVLHRDAGVEAGSARTARAPGWAPGLQLTQTRQARATAYQRAPAVAADCGAAAALQPGARPPAQAALQEGWQARQQPRGAARSAAEVAVAFGQSLPPHAGHGLPAAAVPAEDAAQRAIEELLTMGTAQPAANSTQPPPPLPHQQLLPPQPGAGPEPATRPAARSRKRRRSDGDAAIHQPQDAVPEADAAPAPAQPPPQTSPGAEERPAKVQRRASAPVAASGSPKRDWQRLYASDNGWAAPAFRCNRLPSSFEVS